MKSMPRFFLLTVSCFVFACVGNNKSDLSEGYVGNEKRIEYFYTNFYTDHNEEKLFEIGLREKYENMTYNKGATLLDSTTFEEIYDKLLTLKADDVKTDGFLGVYYQFMLIEHDSLKRLIVLNSDNFFSIDGVGFVRNDTLAYQLKKVLNIYSKYSVDRRKKFFVEAQIFNLDTISIDSTSKAGELLSYFNFKGQLVPKL